MAAGYLVHRCIMLATCSVLAIFAIPTHVVGTGCERCYKMNRCNVLQRANRCIERYDQLSFVRCLQDFPADELAREKAVEMGKEDMLAKPEAIREKIVQGRLDKTKNIHALISQPYIRDDTKLLNEYLQETIATVGENMTIRRCVSTAVLKRIHIGFQQVSSVPYPPNFSTAGSSHCFADIYYSDNICAVSSMQRCL